jgi:hypothetical protein
MARYSAELMVAKRADPWVVSWGESTAALKVVTMAALMAVNSAEWMAVPTAGSMVWLSVALMVVTMAVQ